LLRSLDAQQRKVLTLFEQAREVTAKEIAELLGVRQRSAAGLCQRWSSEGFLVVANASKKARRCRLNDELEARLAG
jgi:DNA-binding MarR family transcriptional regulator